MPSVPRLGWPLILLLLGLGCFGLAVVEAWRTLRSNRVVAERALRGYAGFAVWSYREHLAEALRATAREVLGAVNHGVNLHTSPKIPDASALGHFLPWDEACACHRTFQGPLPLEYLGFKLGTDTMAAGRNLAPPVVDGWLADPPRGERREKELALLLPSEQRWLQDTLTRLARAGPSPWGYFILATRMRDSSRLFAMTLMPTVWGDTIVYAAEYSPRAVDSLLSAVRDDRGLLPAELVAGRRNRDILGIEVRDPEGTPLFASGAPAQWSTAAVSIMPPSYGRMRLQVQIPARLASDLVIGGLPSSRLPLLLVLLALAAGLTAVAVVQLRREARFARERTAFVASVSHELRTPLAQIRLATDTLQLGRETDPAHQGFALSLVDREVTRLQHLVERILRFARGERPQQEAETPDPVDLAEETRRVVSEFEPLARSRGVSVACLTDGAPVVRLRPGSLRQILLNLLDNAVKYGPSGQTVTVRVEPGPDGGARLTVRDEGPGVPAAERDRIWLPFQRGQAAEASALGGGGIGLTVVREIALAHGGRALVNGEPGGGACFVIEFPNGTG